MLSAVVLSEDLTSSGGFWGSGCKSGAKVVAGMESGFGGTSGSDGHGRGNKNLEAEKGLGQGFDLTTPRLGVAAPSPCGTDTFPAPSPFLVADSRF